jgi:predicted acetyltransferase
MLWGVSMFFKSWFARYEERFNVNYEKLRLITPDIRYWRSFKNSYRGYRAHKVEDFAYPKVDTLEEFSYFLRSADEHRRGLNVPYGSVPTSLFWLTDDVNYLASGSIRHYLNDNLKLFGGHIGYSVRTEVWGMGLGTILLGYLLPEARKLGIIRPRLTCYESNTASRRVMEKNGAVFMGRVVNRINGKDRPTLIFEIDLTMR